jgi:hypothetical protein
MRKIVSLVMALLVLVTAAGIAVVWAWDRGTSPTERILLTSLAVVVVLAVHVLPALIKRPVVWALWTVCLCVAIYSHAGFFSMVTVKSAEVRGEQSVQRQAIQTQIEEIKATLATIKARPVAQVSTILSYTKDPVRIEVLTLELAESQRAAKLRDDLVALTATQTTNVSVADAVTDLMTRVTGLSVAAVTLSVNLITALLLELIGVMLWLEVFGGKPEMTKAVEKVSVKPQPTTAVAHAISSTVPPVLRHSEPTVQAVVEPRLIEPAPAARQAAITPDMTPPTQPTPIERRSKVVDASDKPESVIIKDIDYTNSELEINLMQAMISGECIPTVSGIRNYLNCSQSVAVNIQRHMADWIKSLDLAAAEE